MGKHLRTHPSRKVSRMKSQMLMLSGWVASKAHSAVAMEAMCAYRQPPTHSLGGRGDRCCTEPVQV